MRIRSLLLALGLCAAPALAAPADAPVRAVPSEGRMSLFVELFVNGKLSDAIVAVTQDGGRLLIDAEALRSAGVNVVESGPIDLASYAAIRTTYDVPEQRLLLEVPAALLPTQHIAAVADPRLSPIVDAGALLNYDLFVSRAGGATTASLWTEQRAFDRRGMISNTGLLHAGGRRAGYTRLDSFYRYTDEAKSLEITAGDLISRALPWSTAVRVGGVQITRNFALRPDLITVPLPSFAGEAAVPSGLDLYVNGYRQARTEVTPGRFVLDSVPVVNGAGEARIVTTDAVGRQVATVIPFYVAPDLLRRGLTDFSVEIGALRLDHGRSSFGYGAMIASASLRHGITSHLTLSAHAEGRSGMGNGGIGLAWAPGLWGALSGALAASRTARATGSQITLGYTYTGRRISFGAEHVERSRGYTDLGSFDLGRFAGSMRSDRASIALPIDGAGSFGAAYVAARSRDGAQTRLVSASWSMPLGRHASLFAATDYDVRRGTISAQVRFVLPLGRGTIASGGLSRDPSGATRAQASVSRSVSSVGGIGYSADAAVNGEGRFLGQASGSWRNAVLQAEAGVATSGDASSAWGSVTGAMAMLDGQAYAANALPGAFALVSTDARRVPVYYENQLMGRTDERGRLFVPSVTPRQAGRFAIDPIDLPIGAIAHHTERRVAIRAGAGAIIRLPVSFHRSVTAHLVDRDGTAIPPGTLATLAGGRTSPIGWDGVIVLEDVNGPVDISVATATGSCSASATVPLALDDFADLGPLTCR